MDRLSTRSRLMVLGRLALFGACLAAPDLVVGMLGFPERSATTRAFARMVGTRDLAIALLLVSTAPDRVAHRRALQIAGLVDLGDVVCIWIGAARDPAMRKAAVTNLPFAGGSAMFSFLAARSV